MVITSVSAVNAYFAQKMWASAGLPISKYPLEKLSWMHSSPSSSSSCSLSAYADKMHNGWNINSSFLERLLKKSWQLLMWGQFRMKYYFLWSHISMFLQEKQMTRRIFSLSFSSYIYSFPLKVCLSAATTVQCAQKMGPAPNPSFFSP